VCVCGCLFVCLFVCLFACLCLFMLCLFLNVPTTGAGAAAGFVFCPHEVQNFAASNKIKK